MRIAFVYDALVPYTTGGAERRFHELATRLAVRHDVHYVTWRFWGPEPTMVRDGITYHGVGTPRAFYGADGLRTVREMVAFAVRLAGVLARLDVDVIDISATPYLPVYSAWLATRVTHTPLVATWHEYWGPHWQTYLADRPIVARLARVAEQTARPLADHRVAVSEFTSRRMGGPRASRGATTVVANGVDLARLAVPAPSRRRDLVFVGRLISEKRVDLLIQAVARLARDRPRLQCLIVGDGPERDRLTALVVELGVAQQVTFAGRVADDEIARVMSDSRMLVLPSAREGYGITVVEAQACGLVPLVARSPLSAAPDLVRDDEDGLLFDPTVDALVDAIRGLLDDPARLRRMAAAARRSAATSSWEDRAADMEGVYSAVVARRVKAGATRPEAATPDGRSLAAETEW